jgi:hypothetical protein
MDYDTFVKTYSDLACFQDFLRDYKDKYQVVDCNVEELTEEMKDTMIANEEEMKKAMIPSEMVPDNLIHRGLVDVDKFAGYLNELHDIPPLLVASIRAHILRLGPVIGFGVSFVKKTDIVSKMNIAISPTTTPTKILKKTDDQKTADLAKRQEALSKICVEMGIGDEKENIGEIMMKLRESCEVDATRLSMDVGDLEIVVNDDFKNVDDLKEIYDQIDVNLTRTNNDGVRLVNLRGILFGLYIKLSAGGGAEPTLKQTAEFFGVSISLVISSRSFASLVGEFPMFRRVTLNFSIISRNVRRIRKWLDTASKDDK